MSEYELIAGLRKDVQMLRAEVEKGDARIKDIYRLIDKDDEVRLKIKDLTPRRCHTCLFYGSCAIDIPLEVSGCKHWRDEKLKLSLEPGKIEVVKDKPRCCGSCAHQFPTINAACGECMPPFSNWQLKISDHCRCEHVKHAQKRPGSIVRVSGFDPLLCASCGKEIK